MDGWRNIAIALIVPRKGEQTAQSCVNAWFRQLGGTPSRYNPAQGGPTKTGETSASRPGLATPCQSTRPTHSLRCTHSPWPTASRLDSRPQWKRPGGRAESTTPCRRGRRVPALCNWLLPTALHWGSRPRSKCEHWQRPVRTISGPSRHLHLDTRHLASIVQSLPEFFSA